MKVFLHYIDVFRQRKELGERLSSQKDDNRNIPLVPLLSPLDLFPRAKGMSSSEELMMVGCVTASKP